MKTDRLTILAGFVVAAAPAYLWRLAIFGIPTTALELLIYTFAGLVAWQYWRSLKLWPLPVLRWPMILLFIAALIGVSVAPDKRAALGILKAWMVDPLLFVWAVGQLPDRQQTAHSLRLGLIAGGALVALTAVWQRLTGELTPDGRVVGLYGWLPAENASANYLAIFLAPIGVLAAGLAVERIWVKWRELTWLWPTAVTGLIGLALIFSWSRAGLGALVAGLGLKDGLRAWPWIKRRAWAKTAVLLISLTALAGAWWFIQPNPALSPEEGGRITTSNNVRWEIWRVTAKEIIPQSPVWGIGLGHFQDYFTTLTAGRVNFDRIAPLALTPHNFVLAVWVNLGLLGLAAFGWAVFAAVRRAWVKLSRSYRENESLAWSLAAGLGSLGALLLHGAVDTPYFKNDLSLLFWTVLVLLLFWSEPKGKEHP